MLAKTLCFQHRSKRAALYFHSCSHMGRALIWVSEKEQVALKPHTVKEIMLI